MVTGKYWIILNPIAGKGKAAKQHPKIERFMRSSGRDFEIIRTKGPGDALDIVRNLSLAENDVTVAAGGDGTCNELANALIARPAPAIPILGVLPVGRGNDFSSTAGIPGDLEKALHILLDGQPRPLDVGFVKGGFFPDGRYFVNGLGIGFDTKVVFTAAKMKIQNSLSYILGAAVNFARFEPSPVIRIRYGEDEMTLPATIVSLMNGRRMGGIFFMGANALLDDGLLDICFMRHPPTRLKLFKLILHYIKGTQAGCDGIYTSRAARFYLEAIEGGMAAHCDGETVCYDGKNLEVSCIPGALRIIGA
ncbi:MAG: diacylglycerol kinase family lipid kinase [Treponema sp.]|nr:diacylglycerol kinase family lipid kinase [Treponema sp.]